MKRCINEVVGFKVIATDGELGNVEEFYFDDESWRLRYMVVNIGDWRLCKQVLISPAALEKPDWAGRIFPVNLTMDQIRKSPDINTDKPVSRQQEEKLHKHYAWPVYWPQNICTSAECGFITMIAAAAVSAEEPEDCNSNPETTRRKDPHLRSTHRVIGYTVKANDGEIGHVKDFILDDETWKICHLVVDTGKWIPGSKFLVAPKWIEKVSWAASKVFLYTSRESVKHGPVYDSSKPVSDEYAKELSDYYAKQKNSSR